VDEQLLVPLLTSSVALREQAGRLYGSVGGVNASTTATLPRHINSGDIING
jgi:hypothetical protein